MHYSTFNDAWKSEVINAYVNGSEISPRQLKCKEVINRQFTITDPRSRLISINTRKMSPFYAIGELLWYLSGSNELDFISYYSSFWKKCSDDNETLNSAYGHRIFGHHPDILFNQFDHVVKLLSKDPYSRQAIIHFKLPSSVKTKDEVCTLSMQFLIRDEKLHAITNMRSNDVMWGTTYDIYFFTILQEMLALKLKVNLGYYYHTAGSLHLYKKDYKVAENLLNRMYKTAVIYKHKPLTEGFIRDIPALIEIEEVIRTTGSLLQTTKSYISNDIFSTTIVALLVLYTYYRNTNYSAYAEARRFYDIYIMDCYKTLLIPFDEKMKCL